MQTLVLRRISGALILAIALGMSTGEAVAASGYRRTKTSRTGMQDLHTYLRRERELHAASQGHGSNAHRTHRRHEAYRSGVG